MWLEGAMKKIELLIILLFLSYSLFVKAQTLLLEDNFDYGNTATDLVTASSSVWNNHSGGTGTSDVQYTISGLSYAGYPSSGVGGSSNALNSRGGDDNRSFTTQNSGTVYLSAIVNVSSATTSSVGGYFLHFGSTGTHYARLYVRNSSSNLLFGISKSTEDATFSTTDFSFNSTYLIVIKYTFLGGVQNDRIDLWVLTSGVPSSEAAAGTPTVENVTATSSDASGLSAVSLRQGGNAYSVTVDGIRVSDAWSQAPLPVELISFSAVIVNEGIKLNWSTETEVNNYGFEVERKVSSKQSAVGNWARIGFVEGNGNSNSPKEYSFVDDGVTSGKYSYRLKQIDNDGTFEYSKIIKIDVDAPLEFELSQNYPNPFNPSTTIKFSLPTTSSVKLSVFNILGEEVQILVNETKEAGIYTINFNASQLNSGIYFYKLVTRNFLRVKKMSLIR